MIKAIFFDFDGVLTTAESGYFTTCNNIQKTVPEVPLERILKCNKINSVRISCGEISYQDIWEKFCNCIGKSIDINNLQGFFRNTPKNKKMFRFCKSLAKNYRIGIITTNGKERFSLLEKEWKLSKLFNPMIISADVGVIKNNKLIFEKALEEVRAKPEECVFIDNTKNNLSIPQTMGFKTFWHNYEKNDINLLINQLKTWGIKT